MNHFFFVPLLRDWYRLTIKQWIILISTRFLNSASLVQGLHKAPNHLNFYSLLDFCESRTGPPQDTESFSFLLVSLFSQVSSRLLQGIWTFSFYSLLNFRESHQLRLFSTSKPRAVWHKATTQSGVTTSSTFAGLLRSLGSYLCWCLNLLRFIYFPGRPRNFWGHTSRLRYPCRFHGTSTEWNITCVMLMLWNKSISCYATHGICAACQRGSSS